MIGDTGFSQGAQHEDREGTPVGGYGWNPPPPDETRGGGRGETFRFAVPPPERHPYAPGQACTKRVLFLTDVPWTIYEHDLYGFKGGVKGGPRQAICLRRHNLDPRGCPVCQTNEDGCWPSYVGLFGVIDLGIVRRLPGGGVQLMPEPGKENKTYQFRRRVLAAKWGGKDKPGMLQKLQALAESFPDGAGFKGCVFDTKRMGLKESAIGEMWTFVERVAPTAWGEYLADLGAPADSIGDIIAPWDMGAESTPVSYEELVRLIGADLPDGAGRQAPARGGRGQDVGGW